jgi:hypothetical protein
LFQLLWADCGGFPDWQPPEGFSHGLDYACGAANTPLFTRLRCPSS